jgi:hypothetical protein
VSTPTQRPSSSGIGGCTSVPGNPNGPSSSNSDPGAGNPYSSGIIWYFVWFDLWSGNIMYILCKYFYSLTSIFVVSTTCIDPWVLEFVVLNSTGNNQCENDISLDFNFHRLSEARNPRKLEPHD